mmetsp:Transcript_25839/g.65755  ORF Transcript_25839/g.65755 Transcript_25839/m.65755 type:complete len:226 (+) Transcript_25839:665-1342(+)
MATAAAAGSRVRGAQAHHPPRREAGQCPARRRHAQARRLWDRQGDARQVRADHRGRHAVLHGARAALQGKVRHEERHVVPRLPGVGALYEVTPQPEQGSLGGSGTQGPQQAPRHVGKDGAVRPKPRAHRRCQEDAHARARGESLCAIAARVAALCPQEAGRAAADAGAWEGGGGRDPGPAASPAAAAAAAAPASIRAPAPEPPRAAAARPGARGPRGASAGGEGG